jgi:hypothetical protein
MFGIRKSPMNRNEHGFWRFGMSLAVEHDTTPAPRLSLQAHNHRF